MRSIQSFGIVVYLLEKDVEYIVVLKTTNSLQKMRDLEETF